VVVDEEADVEDSMTEVVVVDEEADVGDSTTEDAADQEVAGELRPTVEVSETSRARSRLFKSRGIA